MSDQPKLCPGCGGEMRGSETAYPCGRKPVAGSLETTQCVRHQLFDARVRVAQLERCLAFFASVIKSGEPWTETCEAEYRKAVLS